MREATKQLICTSTGSPPSFGRTRESYVFGSCRKDRMTASVTTVASLSFIRIALFLVPELVGRMSVSWLYASFFSHQRLINGFVLGSVYAFACTACMFSCDTVSHSALNFTLHSLVPALFPLYALLALPLKLKFDISLFGFYEIVR